MDPVTARGIGRAASVAGRGSPKGMAECSSASWPRRVGALGGARMLGKTVTGLAVRHFGVFFPLCSASKVPRSLKPGSARHCSANSVLILPCQTA